MQAKNDDIHMLNALLVLEDMSLVLLVLAAGKPSVISILTEQQHRTSLVSRLSPHATTITVIVHCRAGGEPGNEASIGQRGLADLG